MEQTPIDVESLVKEFELKLERLRVLYEQYFLGLHKREPLVQLKDVVRIQHQLDKDRIRNTAVRFRYRTLVQKLNSYKTYWGRTRRAIDNGTYHRDVARVRRSLARQGITLPETGRQASPGQIEQLLATASRAATSKASQPIDGRLDTTGPPAPEQAIQQRQDHALGTTGPPAPSAQPANVASGAGLDTTGPPAPGNRAAPTEQKAASKTDRASAGLSATEVQSIYRRFVKAKQMCGEDTSSVRYDALAQTLNRELPKLRQKHSGRDIEFEVVIRAGRAVLKAKPK